MTQIKKHMSLYVCNGKYSMEIYQEPDSDEVEGFVIPTTGWTDKDKESSEHWFSMPAAPYNTGMLAKDFEGPDFTDDDLWDFYQIGIDGLIKTINDLQKQVMQYSDYVRDLVQRGLIEGVDPIDDDDIQCYMESIEWKDVDPVRYKEWYGEEITAFRAKNLKQETL